MNIFTNITYRLTFVFIFFAHLAFSANIGIVESQSFHPLQVMDTKWETIVTTMGHTATILPQTSLDDIDNLAGYDVLVVTNGLIMMPVSRQEVIRDYVAQGGNVYIQAEYQVTEPGNEIFEYVVTQLGATFSWTGEANGSLTPMNVFGDLAEGNAPISAIDHYWYGAYGSGGDHIIPFLEYENKNYGFIFCSTNPAHGKVITTSDQDWIRLGYNPELVQNMVDYLTANSNITIPSIFVSVSDTEPCDGEPVTFTANVGSTPSSITYQWMVNNVAILGATDVSFTSVFNNGDLVNCQITFSESCASEQVLTPPLEILTIFPLGNPPVLTVSTASTTICSTESVTAFATVTNIAGVNNMTYQWMLNGQEILGATSAVFQINTMNDGDVLNCIMAYDAPCSNSNQVVATPITFTVNTSMTPLVTISSDFANICAGESIDFSANVAQISSTPTYQWMVDGVAVGTDAPLFTTSSLTDGQTVTCIVTSNDACATIPTATSNALVINVSTPTTPTLTIQADQTTVCAGENVTFTATGTSLGSDAEYEWFIDGISTNTNNTTFTTNNLTNNQSVTCHVTTNESCLTTNSLTSTPISIEVTTVAAPTLTITSSATTICSGSEVLFTATGNNLGTSPQYQWLVDGTITGNTTNTFNTTFTNEQTVSCIVTATNTCSGTLTANSNEIEITIGHLAIQVVDILPESCDNANGQIEILATGGVGPYTYNWDNNTTNTNTLNQLSAGSYSVVVSDVNGCSAALQLDVPYITPPVIEMVDATHINCSNAGGTATVIMADSNADYSYVWKNSDNKVIANFPTVQNLQEGLYVIEVSNAYGCMVSDEIYIDAVAPLQVKILEETTIELGEEYRLQVVTNYPDATFSWKADESLSCDDCMTPTVAPTHTTTYYVTATTAEGCTATAHVIIQVAKPRHVFVPNAFSPNNDGLNDKFVIFGGDDVAQVKSFQVFDRWGTVVYSNENFQVNDDAQGWDGKIGNKEITTGVFIYFAEIEFIDGRTEVYKGDVTATK